MPLLSAGAFFDGSGGGPAGALDISGTPVTTADNGNTISWTAHASGGSLPYVFSVHAGTLPTGITLNSSTGVVGGTLTEGGVFAGIIIRVTDGAAATADLSPFTMSIFPGVPAGATAFLDFVYKRYFVGSTEYVVTDLVGGTPFVPATAIFDRGLEVDDTTGAWPKAIGDFFTAVRDLSGGKSVVVEVDRNSLDNNGPFMHWADVAQGVGADDQYFYFDYFLDGDAPTIEFLDWYDLYVAAPFPSLATGDPMRIGITLGTDNGDGTWHYALTANGETPVSQDTTYSADAHLPSGLATSVELGGWKTLAWNWTPVGGAFIQRIEFYPGAADDAALRVLAAQSIPLSGGTSGVPVTGLVGGAYTGTVIAWGGVPGYTFSIHSGTLPAGLSLDSATGIISGTPTGAEADAIVIRITDAGANTVDLPSFTLTIQSVIAVWAGHYESNPAPSTHAARSFSINVGAAAASRIVVIALHNFEILAAPDLSINGNLMEVATWQYLGSGTSLALYYYPLPSGTSATLSLPDVGGILDFEVAAVYGTGSSPLLEHAASGYSTTNPTNCSIAVNTGGVTITAAASYNAATGGVTFNQGAMLDDFVAGRIGMGVIYGASNTTLSLDATFVDTGTFARYIAAASFGP